MKKLLLISLLIVGCDHSISSYSCENCSISGQVKDSAGNPLNNAAILLTYDNGYRELGRMQMPTTTIKYGVEEDSFVLLWIESMCEDTVKILVNGFQTAGYHSITWNVHDSKGNLVVDGMYKAYLSINDGELLGPQNILSTRFVYDHQDLEMIDGKLGYTEIINWETQQDTFYTQNYHAMTDEHGNFSIPSDCLSFGAESVAIDGEYGDSLYTSRLPFITKLWIFHEEHTPFETDWYDVDKHKNEYNRTILNVDIQIP